MKRLGSHGGGYTIVETMIFLAVSSALLLIALSYMGARQARTQFTTGVRDFESRIQDIMNDTATGYFNNNGTYNCTVAGNAAPSIGAGASPQGTSLACIFIGKAIQFEPDTLPSTIQLHTLVGRRLDTNGRDVSSIEDAKPVVVEQEQQNIVLPFGIKVKSLSYNGGSSAGTIAFLSSFAGSSSFGGAVSSTQAVELRAISGTSLGQTVNLAKNQVNNTITTSDKNPSTGVTLCVEGGSGQRATIVIGGPNRQASTLTTIEEGSC